MPRGAVMRWRSPRRSGQGVQHPTARGVIEVVEVGLTVTSVEGLDAAGQDYSDQRAAVADERRAHWNAGHPRGRVGSGRWSARSRHSATHRSRTSGRRRARRTRRWGCHVGDRSPCRSVTTIITPSRSAATSTAALATSVFRLGRPRRTSRRWARRAPGRPRWRDHGEGRSPGAGGRGRGSGRWRGRVRRRRSSWPESSSASIRSEGNRERASNPDRGQAAVLGHPVDGRAVDVQQLDLQA